MRQLSALVGDTPTLLTDFIVPPPATGVILSVSFIHLLYHAFIMFGNDCLGELAFEPAAPAISLAALIIILYVFILA